MTWRVTLYNTLNEMKCPCFLACVLLPVTIKFDETICLNLHHYVGFIGSCCAVLWSF